MKSVLKSLLIAVALTLAPPALAQNTQATAVLELVQQGKFAQARALLKSFNGTPLDALFLEAQIARAEGDLKEAVAIYREILVVEPALLLARRGLVQTLLDLKDFEAAEFHLKILNRSDPSPAARANYQQALAQISSTRPFGVSATFALVPSSNISRGTFNERFEVENGSIPITSTEKSGIGAQLGLSGYITTKISERGSLTFRASGFHTKYTSSEFDRSSISASVSYSLNLGETSWEIAPYFLRAFESQSLNTTVDYSRTGYGLNVTHRRLLDRQTRLTFALGAGQTNYDEVDDTQSGPNYSLGVTLERQLSPTLALLGGFRLGRNEPQADAFKNFSYAVRGGVSKTWKGGFSTYVELELGARKYDGNFAERTFPRDDQYLALSANVLNSRLSLQGFAPRLGCSLVMNRSNIEFYDYNVQECRVSLTRGF